MTTANTATANSPTLTERVCSDCELWTPITVMVETPAGNSVCPRCAKRRERLASERDQLSMFGQQSLL